MELLLQVEATEDNFKTGLSNIFPDKTLEI